MACIQQRGERKYKITVCNGYKPNGQKRMQARTITVPKEVAKRGIQQYVMAEAERLEKRFRTGIDQSENTRFEDYANRWLERMAKRYKVSTLEGYRRMLEAVYPAIGGLPLCKIRPMVLEELCEELRQRPGRNGQSLSENTVHKYLDTISAVLQDAVKNDILLYNPAHRVDKLRVERTPQRIPQAWEMQKLLQCILQEPLLYRVYYLLALSTGLRRGELCALRWRDLHGGNQLLIQHSRSTVVGKGVIESDTKSHRTRVVVIPQLVYDYLGELLFNQIVENNGIRPDDLIFTHKGKPIHPDTFSAMGSRKITTCTRCGTFSPPTCWKTAPASRSPLICWATRTPRFSSAPTAIRRTPARSRRQGCWIRCCSRRMLLPGSRSDSW